MTVSIIIVTKTWQRNLEECIGRCRKLDFSDFEILVLPDEPIDKEYPRSKDLPISIFPTGMVCPAYKRDMAIKYAKGEILAFVDDDAYPREDWLKNALVNFNDENVAAVGGPAVTADDDSFRQKASGAVYSSFLVSGEYAYRYLPKKKREVHDYPSCNFIMRKSIIQELNGFNTNFWPGEDTKLCLDITKKLGKKIIYDPQVLVWHHRRPLFIPHLKQVARYALHRGYFVKRYPQTSCRPAYFVPAAFVLAVITGGVLSIFFVPIRLLYLLSFYFYILLVFIYSISKELRLIPLVFPGIILTHVVYGIYFLKGLISRKLKEE
jgi:GT2 family glycosyltransferase